MRRRLILSYGLTGEDAGIDGKILFNMKTGSHLAKLKAMSKQADTFIIVSPFLSDDMAGILKQMPDIRGVTLYTTLDKYDDTVQKVLTLSDFYGWCGENGIDLIININEELHGNGEIYYVNAIKERILGTVTVMNENDAHTLWNLIIKTLGQTGKM